MVARPANNTLARNIHPCGRPVGWTFLVLGFLVSCATGLIAQDPQSANYNSETSSSWETDSEWLHAGDIDLYNTTLKHLREQNRTDWSNLSTRAKSIAGGGELVTGFVVEGTGKLPLLLRAVAPTLAGAPFNLAGTISDPTLRLSFNQDFLESYDNWGETSDPVNLSVAAQRIGAFPLNSGSLDTAALREYAPGVYTARLEEKQGESGIALLELYDATEGQSSAQLTNISSRAVVGSGDDVLVPGVVIAGDALLRVLIRALDPTLTTYGVTNVLADPQFSVLRDGETVGSNNDWKLFPRRDELVAASNGAGAFALEEDSKDAAAILTLEPGVYTVLVSGVGDTTGQALVELYKLKN